MDKHFASLGPYGQRMMRQTCTVQVNLDFGPDDASLAKRYLLSQLMAPVAAAAFAYSPVVDRQRQGIPGFRTRIWRHADDSRTGLPGLDKLCTQVTCGGARARDLCIDTYLEFALNAQVIFVTALGYKVPDRRTTFGEWLEQPIDGVSPTIEDFKTHLTLMFPEVRPRGFLELRSIDCQPRAFQAVPAAFATGLLYEPRTLDSAIELLLPHRAELPRLLARAEAGLADPVLADLAKRLMQLAAVGFSALPPCFKTENGERELAVFRERFTERGLTPGDVLVQRMAEAGEAFPSFETFRALESDWGKAIS
jgi:glutamate--cysteine ligase